MTTPRMPSSAIPSISSRSSRWSMSFWTATGSTRSSTNARTVSWVRRCSSVSSKSTLGGGRPLVGERGQPVDRLAVALDDVLAESVRPLALEPPLPLRTVRDEVHQRNAEAARVRDPVEVDADHGADAVRARVGGGDELPPAVQADDARRPVEGTEHHADPAVLADV